MSLAFSVPSLMYYLTAGPLTSSMWEEFLLSYNAAFSVLRRFVLIFLSLQIYCQGFIYLFIKKKKKSLLYGLKANGKKGSLDIYLVLQLFLKFLLEAKLVLLL